MASIEKMKEFSTLGREMGLSGGELSSFVTDSMEREREREKEVHELRLAQIKIEQAKLEERPLEFSGIKLKVGKFDESTDSFDSYITKFELLMDSQNVPKQVRCLHLISNLTGKSLDVVNRMNSTDRTDYDRVKRELMEYFHLTENGYRKKFRSVRPNREERPKQFAVRMKGYFDKWLDLSGVGDYDSLVDLVVREQFLDCCPREVVGFLKERNCGKLHEMVECAEIYVHAHGLHTFIGHRNDKFNPKNQNQRQNQNQKQKLSQIHNTKSVLGPQADRKPKYASSTKNSTKPSYGNSGTKNGCYMCGSPNHLKWNCPMKPIVHSAQAMSVEDTPLDSVRSENSGLHLNRNENFMSIGTLRSDDRASSQSKSTGFVESSAGCVLIGNPMITVPSESESVETLGMAYDEVGAMIDDMPVVSGRLLPKNKPVSVLKDSGSSTSVVRTSLVLDNQFTGVIQLVRLIDGTLRRFPRANIMLDSPYFIGEINALCMPNCLCDVIIGNDVKGAREPKDPDLQWVPSIVQKANSSDVDDRVSEVDMQSSEVVSSSEDNVRVSKMDESVTKVDEVLDDVPSCVDEAMAVETRAQKQSQSKPKQDLKVRDSGVKVKSEDFLREQKDDLSLKPLWNKVNDIETKSRFLFMSEKNCLYRQERDMRNPSVGVGPKLVVVPKTHRSEIMRIAHDSLFGGHLGINNTLSKVKAQFYWPSMYEDVANFCRSCDVCQKTVSKGRVPKTTLGKLPIVGVPFQRIAIDLMGPFIPSARGHTHILTIVDYATRYVEAIPLKSISTVDVAEALVTVYSRVGVPCEVMSDLGTQFVSDLMRKVSQLLSVKQITSSRYHPMCNGLVERYNGVIKTALRRLCSEEPRQWDRYLPALLFALREAPSSSLGFSPFELLYGRHVRGPMDILRELWTNESIDAELGNEYEYVIDLRKRLVESWQLAQDTLKSSAKRYPWIFEANHNRNSITIRD
ncbi:uncharacterized protein LOC129282954 isoform X2 [Lytechinus pictus]|uniref:uncharacterized protein LOC129282954 isoform X2 n=1 Tax=Lytechinus pictus TaxID=7653 RepID=UPI0030B9F095